MRVILSSLYNGHSISPLRLHRCNTLHDCQMAVKLYIMRYHLTEDTWTGGQVSLYGNDIGRFDINANFIEY